MPNIKKLVQEKTILFSIIIFCIFTPVFSVTGLLFRLLPDTMLFDFLYELINILWPVALSFLCGFPFIYSAKGFWSTLIAGISFFGIYGFLFAGYFFLAYVSPNVQWQTPPAILLAVLSMIGIGIREEVLFRGIIVNSLAMKYATDKKGLWFAVIISSLLFGCVHISNIFVGVKLSGLIAQIIGSAAIGLFHAAVYLRGGNIWVPIMIHALQDAAVAFVPLFTVTTMTEVDQMSNTNVGTGFIMVGICVALSMFLLRKSKRPAVFARLDQLRSQYDQTADHK